VPFYAKLRFVSHTQRACSQLQFLRVIDADAEVLRLAVCKLYRARYGTAEDVMTASLSSRTQQVLAVDISELDTKLVTIHGETQAVWAGLVEGWSSRAGVVQEHVWHDMQAQCILQPIT